MRARIKNQQNKHKITKQASRRLKPAPEKLQAILDLVNMVSPDAELADVFQLWRDLNERAIAELKEWYETNRQELEQERAALGPPDETVDYLDRILAHSQKMLDFSGEQLERTDALTQHVGSRAVEALNQCLSGLAQPFRDYAWQVGEEPLETETAINEAIARYTFVRESREKLRLISHIANAENPQDSFFLAPQLRSYAQIMIDESGELYIAKDRFAAAIDGIEAKRIRECEVCRRIFWAGRIDQPSCSTVCAHALRNRRYRARYKDYLVRQHLKETSMAAADAKPLKTGKGKANKDS